MGGFNYKQTPVKVSVNRIVWGPHKGWVVSTPNRHATVDSKGVGDWQFIVHKTREQARQAKRLYDANPTVHSLSSN